MATNPVPKWLDEMSVGRDTTAIMAALPFGAVPASTQPPQQQPATVPGGGATSLTGGAGNSSLAGGAGNSTIAPAPAPPPAPAPRPAPRADTLTGADSIGGAAACP
jgi:hypothetical protein